MNLPSLTLLSQSAISGLLGGGLYGLVALGLSLNWGLLRLLNLGHFGFVFLAAYATWQLGEVQHLAPWYSAIILVPLFFCAGVALHALFERFRVDELTSLLVTFGIAVIIETLIQLFWTADFHRYESGYGGSSIPIGRVFIPTLELFCCAAAVVLALAIWAWLRWSWIGRALRASVDDAPMARAFGINSTRQAYLLAGICGALAAISGVFIALITTLTPTAMWSWVGVIFAVVIIGGLGNPLGALGAGVLIGVSEQLTMAVIAPAWAPVVSFSLLILLLLVRPSLR